MQRIKVFYKFMKKYIISKWNLAGINITYRCLNKCRHCIYEASPKRKEVMEKKDVDKVVKFLKKQELTISSLHIGGGEPLLYPDLCLYVAKRLKEETLFLDFVETSFHTNLDEDELFDVIDELFNLGMQRLVVSYTPFHLEWMSLDRLEYFIYKCYKRYGVWKITVWVPGFSRKIYQILDDNLYLDWNKFENFLSEDYYDLIDYVDENDFPLSIIGRAAFSLDKFYYKYSAEKFKNDHCAYELLNAKHGHVGPKGEVTLNFCSHLIVGTVEDFYNDFSVEVPENSIFSILVSKGPYALYQYAKKLGFSEREFATKCHLCSKLSKFLKKKLKIDHFEYYRYEI